MNKNHTWKYIAEELLWAIEQINMVNHDRNPNRQAQISAAIEYGIQVGINARIHEPLPNRPDIESAI